MGQLRDRMVHDLELAGYMLENPKPVRPLGPSPAHIVISLRRKRSAVERRQP